MRLLFFSGSPSPRKIPTIFPMMLGPCCRPPFLSEIFLPLKSGGNLAVTLLATNATPQHHQQEMLKKHHWKPFLGWSMAGKTPGHFGDMCWQASVLFCSVHIINPRCFFMARQFRRFKTMRKTKNTNWPCRQVMGKSFDSKVWRKKGSIDISSAIPEHDKLKNTLKSSVTFCAARSVFGYLCHLSTDQSVDPEMKKKTAKLWSCFGSRGWNKSLTDDRNQNKGWQIQVWVLYIYI